MSAIELIGKVRRLQSLREQLKRERAKTPPRRCNDLKQLGLLEFIQTVSPHLETPIWFAPYIAQLETAVGGEHETVFAGPPQHGKTVVTAHAYPWALLKYPAKRFAYATYNLDRARAVSRYVRRISESAGQDLEGTLDHAYTAQGGGIVFAGRGTSITGEPIDGFGVVDDPFKDRAEAESKTIRDNADDWHREVWTTRIHPGTSSFVMATRWHEDDLSGRLIKRGWQSLNLPALAEENDPLGRKPGEPLCPRRWPLAVLLRKRQAVGEYGWSALYQGHPRPRGGTLFEGPSFYDLLPEFGWRIGIGLDLAYSKRTHADYSVVVVLALIDGFYYVVDVLRVQLRAAEFFEKLRPILDRYPGVVPRWYCSGPEKAVGELLAEKLGRRIECAVTHTDKFTRTQPTAADWNAQRILVPRDERAWIDPFVSEARDFTGINDANDDQIDALVAARDSLADGAGTRVPDSFFDQFSDMGNCGFRV